MDDWSALDHARELSRQGRACALATVVWRRGPSSGKEGCRAVISADGAVRGWIGGACAEPTVLREARHVLESGEPRLLLLGPSAEFADQERSGMSIVPISCQSEGALEIFIEPVLPAPHLVVAGNSPMTRALVEMATVLGWHADAVDQLDPSMVRERSFVVIATQGSNDEAALEQALAARPAYIGLVGSAQRGASMLGYLADRGVPREQLQHVQVPAGLDLGHISHREIAVAILAELVRLRAAAPQEAVPMPAAPAAVLDPVCGMTVEAGEHAHPLTHGATTFYFCCPGCRRAFEKDPASYIKESRC